VVRKCLKCGTVNDNATGSPTEACPNCSVIYAKAEAAAVAGKAPPQRPLPTAKPAPRELRLPLWPTVACVTCLIVGFFVGREQMRYQVASAMTGALAHAFDGLASKPRVDTAPSVVSAPATPPPSELVVAPSPPAIAEQAPIAPKEPAVSPKQSITAKLVKKGFRDQDFSGGHFIKAAITFAVQFHNETDKNIRAFDGVLSFNDLLGNRVYAAKLTISDPLSAGQSIQWDGELEYNQFVSDHAKLRGYDLNNTAITLQIHKILFADGTSQTEGQE